jgi:hypothetical protein
MRITNFPASQKVDDVKRRQMIEEEKKGEARTRMRRARLLLRRKKMDVSCGVAEFSEL